MLNLCTSLINIGAITSIELSDDLIKSIIFVVIIFLIGCVFATVSSLIVAGKSDDIENEKYEKKLKNKDE